MDLCAVIASDALSCPSDYLCFGCQSPRPDRRVPGCGGEDADGLQRCGLLRVSVTAGSPKSQAGVGNYTGAGAGHDWAVDGTEGPSLSAAGISRPAKHMATALLCV